MTWRAVRAHLTADFGYQSRLLRFLENHDEPRVADRLRPEAERTAAVAIATLPGATLWHEGQFEGRRVHPPVFLTRRPDEDLDAGPSRLVPAVARRPWPTGGSARAAGRLLDVASWPDNDSSRNLLAWSWTAGEANGQANGQMDGQADGEADGTDRHLIVVNLSAGAAQGRIRLGWPDLAGHNWQLTDLLSDVEFERAGDELAGPGLFVDLPPWQFHLLAVADVAYSERNRSAAAPARGFTRTG